VSSAAEATEMLEREAGTTSEADFAARHPGPFLAFDAPEDDEDLHFMTELGNVPATRKIVLVVPISKRATGPFQDRISVGRARNSDIVIRHASVSKLHAHFRSGDGGLTLTDVGSHNGTKIQGTPLTPHRPEAVRPGMTLVIGAVTARVLDAKSAYDQLRRR
jgi:hypothetical protein